MKIIGVIPSRLASTRFPAKPLALIKGRPLVEWVVRGAQQSKLIQEIIVATDDEKIAAAARAAGARVAMTSPELPSGTDRVWAACENEDADIVLNIQGDEPLIDGKVLDQLAQGLIDSDCEMATLGYSLQDDEVDNFNVAKILLNKKKEAIYFSRFSIPFSREKIADQRTDEMILRHIGLYAYRKNFLKTFCAQKVVLAEQGEALEQLRALYLGARIKVIQTDHVCWGVDTPQDIIKVEKIMDQRS